MSHSIPTRPSPIPAATDKVALLIGNMHYLHHKQLQAPIVDVHALGALLRQLDFKVVSLLDLRKAEMQMAVNEFLLLLDKGVYGATTPAGVAPAQGQLPGFMPVESWGAAKQEAGAGRSGGCHRVTCPLFPRQVCSTMQGTAMKILATASWCPPTLPAPTRPSTACVCSVCCGRCSSAAPASTSSCLTCAERGDPALPPAWGQAATQGEPSAGARGCWLPGEAGRAPPGSHLNPLSLSERPKASLPLCASKHRNGRAEGRKAALKVW